MNKKPYHVIFLGAGASATSGYPVGQELRLRIASKKHFEGELQKLIPDNTSQPDLRNCRAKCLKHFDDFDKSVELFRHGGFATVDEFSKLASEGYQEHVQNMKKLMRVALLLHNPEDKFHESDYYSFIQQLYQDDSLNELRRDITIITFNYDCYLDFLLLESFRHRQKVLAIPKEPDDWLSNKLTSGFFNPTGGFLKPNAGEDWTQQTQGFNYFKLHGSISYGNDPYFGYHASFRLDKVKRLEYLGEQSIQTKTPPVVFPWELFDGDTGDFVKEDKFVFYKESKDEAAKQEALLLFRHFKTIWENARQTVLRADKISFVGLSMHEYLASGFSYLFQKFGKASDLKGWVADGTLDENKPKEVQMVVANLDNEYFKNAKNRLQPASLCGKVADLLKHVAPNLKYVRSSSEDDGMFRGEPTDINDPDITPRYSFKEFIEREMD